MLGWNVFGITNPNWYVPLLFKIQTGYHVFLDFGSLQILKGKDNLRDHVLHGQMYKILHNDHDTVMHLSMYCSTTPFPSGLYGRGNGQDLLNVKSPCWMSKAPIRWFSVFHQKFPKIWCGRAGHYHYPLHHKLLQQTNFHKILAFSDVQLAPLTQQSAPKTSVWHTHNYNS